MNDSSVFATELSWIHDETLERFATYCLENAPQYFYEIPASSSGKNHSLQVVGHGGLVKHVRAVAYLTKQLSRSYQLTEQETDAAIVAALLHDIVKWGNSGEKHTVDDHDLLSCKFISMCAGRFTQFVAVDIPTLPEICSAVSWHMGPWSKRKEGVKLKKFPEEYSKIEQLVHIADMAASRKAVKFDFLEANSYVG